MEDNEVNKCLWKPNRRRKTKMDIFREHVNKKYGKDLADYLELYRWSIEDIEDFWETWWEFGKFLCMITPCQVLEPDLTISQVPRWFIGARLNFAANLLRFRDNHTAIYATGEGQERITTITFNELYQKVAACSRALTALGVESGERVVGYLPNCPAAIEAMLASASIGAVWSSTSPDFGVNGVLERFNQIAPSVLFSVEAVVYNGKVHDHMAKVTQVVKGLGDLKKVVIVPFVHKKCDIDISGIPNCVFLDDFVREYEGIKEPLKFAELPFHFPLFIMFSSGTTGEPKCIVHSAGGTLLQITKEHILHCDVDRGDVLTYYTTTGWMMWNWLVVGLYTGCALVLYDGSPLIPTPTILWDLVDKLGITVLGTGAKWLAVLEEKGVKPKETHDLTTLRAILSTGSPLPAKSFRYVYRDIKKDVLLGSISGGTDIISCFMGSNPTLPVYEGEIQSRNLGMAVEAWDDYGQPVFDQSGDLVCTKPFPSMPTHFWNDDGGIKYTKAYFSVFPNTWTHGDYIMINSKTGGITMLGRSDGTLNPSGVRFGSSEIYSVVDQFEEVSDSVCVGQRNQVGEERVILFLKLNEAAEFSQELTDRMRKTIRSQLSARHVPSVILPIGEIPYTISGKKVEVAVRCLIHGQEVKNKSSLVNPESLDLYANLPELQDWVSK